MKTSKRILGVLIALALLATGCGANGADASLTLSGFLEGNGYTVSSEMGGSVTAVLASAGDNVEAGDVLLELDDTTLEFARQQAEAGLKAAQAALQALNDQPSAQEVAAAQAVVAEAEAQLEEAQAALQALEDGYAPFDPPETQQHAAENAVTVAQAAMDLAQAQLEQTQAGALPGEIIAAQAQVDEAEAQLALVEAQIEHLKLRAPVDGVVSQVLVKAGEVAVAGAPLVEVLSPGLTLTVYVPENKVALFSPGDEVQIMVDAYPDETFTGQVSFIADEAQFTPSNVQTREERVKLVFAVEIAVENPSGYLKAGMPADATFTLP